MILYCVVELSRNSDDGNMAQWWDDDKEKMEGILQNALAHCHFLQYQSHMNSPNLYPSLRGQKPAHNRLSPDAVQSICMITLKSTLTK
jgi:hypothetical protein